MYEMCTGLPPFDAESVAEVLAMHKWGDVPRIHETFEEADCPKALEQLIRRCLAKDPADRFQTAEKLAEAISTC